MGAAAAWAYMAANNWVLKSISQSTQKSAQRQKSKSTDIPEGNLVLLQDHPEGLDNLWFTAMQSQMSMTLNQLMVKAQCTLLTNTSCRIWENLSR